MAPSSCVARLTAATRRAGPPQTFGVTEILSGRLRHADAVATTDAHVLTITAHDFFDLLGDNIEIVKALFRQLLHDPETPALR